MSRDHRLYLEDIVSYADEAIGFTMGISRQALSADRRTYFAVLHALQVIGEAAKNLPPEVRSRTSDVPWRRIAGFRDRLVHAYHAVDPEVIWQVVTRDRDLTPLRDAAARLLAELDREGGAA